MRILITGGAGMLGSALVPALVAKQHEIAVTDIELSNPKPWGADGPTLCHLDVRDRDDVDLAVDEVRPDLVIHLAAITSLEECETDPDEAYRTNTVATKYVAMACRRTGTAMAYLSTAGVFDGTKDGAYDEFDDPNPINVYGRSKFEGEKIVGSTVPLHYIIRAGWMVGGGAKDHKFVSHMVTQLAAGSTRLHAVSDKLGTPTYTRDFARTFHGLLDTSIPGTYHMACGGEGSRLDVAAHILKVLGRDDVDLVDVDSAFFAEEFFAPRPRSEVMRNRVLDLQGMNLMRPWREALTAYLLTDFPHMVSDTARERALADDLSTSRHVVDLTSAPSPT